MWSDLPPVAYRMRNRLVAVLADFVDVSSQMMSDRVPAVSDVLHRRSHLGPVVDWEVHDRFRDRDRPGPVR